MPNYGSRRTYGVHQNRGHPDWGGGGDCDGVGVGTTALVVLEGTAVGVVAGTQPTVMGGVAEGDVIDL